MLLGLIAVLSLIQTTPLNAATTAWPEPPVHGMDSTSTVAAPTETTTVSIPEVACYDCSSTDFVGCGTDFNTAGIPTKFCSGRCTTMGFYQYDGDDYVLKAVERTCNMDPSTWRTGCNTDDTICYSYCATRYCNKNTPAKPCI